MLKNCLIHKFIFYHYILFYLIVQFKRREKNIFPHILFFLTYTIISIFPECCDFSSFSLLFIWRSSYLYGGHISHCFIGAKIYFAMKHKSLTQFLLFLLRKANIPHHFKSLFLFCKIFLYINYAPPNNITALNWK